MEIQIESTEQITHLEGVACRVWKGITKEGVECIVFVHRIAVHNSHDQSQFDKLLQEQLPPGKVISLAAVL